MRGWRSKLITLLIIYIAGFATAVYLLGPMPDENSAKSISNSIDNKIDKLQDSADRARRMERKEAVDDFIKTFNFGMHKCVAFVKDMSIRAGHYIKEKIEERQERS